MAQSIIENLQGAKATSSLDVVDEPKCVQWCWLMRLTVNRHRCKKVMKLYITGKLSDPLQAINNPKSLRFCFDVLRAAVVANEERIGVSAEHCMSRVVCHGVQRRSSARQRPAKSRRRS